MPEQIQTSFIPKAPITASAKPAQTAPVGFMTVLALILALASVAAFAGAFAYKEVLTQKVAVAKSSVDRLKEDMSLENLRELEHLNTSLINAKKILASHVSSNRIFALLQQTTIPAVRYSSFNFKGAEVAVKGSARTYEDIAAQAAVFKTMTDKITTANFSDFTVDKITNVVNFNLSLTIAPEAFRYLGEAAPLPVETPATSTATGGSSIVPNP